MVSFPHSHRAYLTSYTLTLPRHSFTSPTPPNGRPNRNIIDFGLKLGLPCLFKGIDVLEIILADSGNIIVADLYLSVPLFIAGPNDVIIGL